MHTSAHNIQITEDVAERLCPALVQSGAQTQEIKRNTAYQGRDAYQMHRAPPSS